MCLYPKFIENPKYKGNKKNGWQPPPVTDERIKYVPIGCNNCIECRKQKRRSWQVRLQEDIKEHTNGKFITLTFSNEKIKELTEIIHQRDKEDGQTIQLTAYDLDNAICTLAVRRFLERWRKEYKKSLRHWLITEIGHQGTENIHMHGIIWTDEHLDKIEKHWQNGWIWKGKRIRGKMTNYVNERTINYITKYVTKIDHVNTTYKAIILTSPGIGANYTKTINAQRNQFKQTETNQLYRTRSGFMLNLPIYYRNKLYTEKQREILWTQLLDKEERWICGEKINAKNDDEYQKLLTWYRERNQQLGYGSDKHSYDTAKYEQQRRTIAQQTRIQKAKRLAGEAVKHEYRLKKGPQEQ